MSVPVWYLEITSWRGITPFAWHYYGRLRSGLDEDRAEIELERDLSLKEIRDENRKEGWAIYRKGDKTKAFDSEDAVIEAAKQYLPANGSPPGSRAILIRGNWAATGPQEILIGPDSLKEIYREWKGWSHPSARALDKLWDETFSKEIER